MEFSFSPQAEERIERFGGDRDPVLVIDNAGFDPEGLVVGALALQFSRIGPYFPGVRAPVKPAYLNSLCEALTRPIARTFGIDAGAWRGECFYSLVTTPPSELAPIQRFPHYDGIEEERIAVLHYLCDEGFGGTSFYKHLGTGFESVNAARFDSFRRALEGEVRERGLPPPAYIGDGAPFFDRIGTVRPAFNRMLVYRGKSLHCSAIENAARLSADPRRGRLTINAFLTPSPHS